MACYYFFPCKNTSFNPLLAGQYNMAYKTEQFHWKVLLGYKFKLKLSLMQKQNINCHTNNGCKNETTWLVSLKFLNIYDIEDVSVIHTCSLNTIKLQSFGLQMITFDSYYKVMDIVFQ